MWKLCFAAIVIAVRGSQETPANKVIALLTDLKAKAQDELAVETKIFAKFLAFCETKLEEKNGAIDENNLGIETANGGIDGATAAIETAQNELQNSVAEQNVKSTELSERTKEHLAAKTVLQKNEADLANAADSLEKAIEQVKAATSAELISTSVKTSIRRNLAVAEALGLSSKTVSFLSNDPGDYESHSGDIIKTLADLLVEFKAKHEEVATEITAVQKAFDEYKTATQKAIDVTKEAAETAKLKENQETENLGLHQKDFSDASIDLSNNEQYHKDLTTRCNTKKAEWEQRELGRTNEIKAMEGALEQLQTVGAKEVSRDVKTFMQKPKIMARKVAVEEDRITLPTFLQTKRFLSPISPHDRAADFLLEQGKKLHSASLVSLFAQLGGPFDKVKALVQRLIERLLDEAAQEATSQGKCATERVEAESNRNHRYEEIQRKNTELSKLSAQKLELESSIDELTTQTDELQTGLQTATELRAEEKESNLKSIVDAKEGETAVAEAVRILKEYYHGVHGVGGADTATVFAQASPVDEEAEFKAVADRKGAYKGNQDSAGNIFGLLEVIQSDFQREIKTTKADEEKSQADFVKQKRDDTANLEGKRKQLENAENDLTIANSKIDLGLSDLQTASDRQGKAIQILDLLWSRCVAVDMSFEERREKVKQEIEALKKVKSILEPKS
eukprot:GEMP01031376.1.p1 GENE.GEMP01031376.1~~GEMP01031376.1.p1  ORF type:complete len:679 (+),score=224.82 GEMP01031376.1:53-2089(+)